MKKCLLLFLLIPSLNCLAQEKVAKLPVNDAGQIEFTEVVAVDSVSAKELYSRSRLFVANAFRSATDVTKLEDTETFTVVTKGLLPRYYSNPFNKTQGGNVRFTFTIQCKDGRYKYSVSNLVHEDNVAGSGGALERDKPQCTLCMTKRRWEDIKRSALVHINGFITELTTTMRAVGVKNDW